MASITINFTPNTVGNHLIGYRDQAVGGAYTPYVVNIALNEVGVPRAETIYVTSIDIYCQSAVYECYLIAGCEDQSDVSPADGVPDAATQFTVDIDPIEDPCKLYQLTYTNTASTATLNWDDLACAGRAGSKVADPIYDANIAGQETQRICSSNAAVQAFVLANPDWNAVPLATTEKYGNGVTTNCHCICYTNVTILNTTGGDLEVHYVKWDEGNADHLKVVSEIVTAGAQIIRDIIPLTVKSATASNTDFSVTVNSDCGVIPPE
jgi:hypothetical protein